MRRSRFFSRSRKPAPAQALDCEHDEGLVEALAGVLCERGYQPSAAQSWARYLIYGSGASRRPCECSRRERIPDGAKPELCYRCSGYLVYDATPAL